MKIFFKPYKREEIKLIFYRCTHGILLFTPEIFRGTKELWAIGSALADRTSKMIRFSWT